MRAPDVSPDEKWVDTHCHLDSLDVPAEEALLAASSAGVTEIINVGTDLSSSGASVELARRFPSVWAAVGIHPHEAKHADHKALEALRMLARQPRVVAIGEIGLDFYRDHSPRDRQIEAFERQLALARDAQKPVVLHIRDAHEEAFRVLESSLPNSGLIFHCFSAGPEEVRHALSMGGYISFAGNISFKKSDSIRQAAALVPLDRLLVETDAPYLAPMPLRGKPNRPALVPHVGRAIAEATGRPVAEIAAVTRANAMRVFSIDRVPENAPGLPGRGGN